MLVVDDDAGFLKTMSELLKRLGFRVLLAGSMRQAWSLSRADVSTVVCDFNLPELTGLDMAEIMRDWRVSGVPFVLVTGTASSEIPKDEPRVGTHIVLKPTDFNRLEVLLRSRRG